MTEVEALKERVGEVFPVHNPPVKLFNYAGSLVNDEDDIDYVGTYKAFLGKLWTEIDYNQLCHYKGGPAYGAFHFLENEAFRYYLPTWLSIILNDPDTHWDMLVDLCEHALPPEITSKVAGGLFRRNFEPLLPQQKAVIAGVIKYASRALPEIHKKTARQAYDAYWSQFDQSAA